ARSWPCGPGRSGHVRPPGPQFVMLEASLMRRPTSARPDRDATADRAAGHAAVVAVGGLVLAPAADRLQADARSYVGRQGDLHAARHGLGPHVRRAAHAEVDAPAHGRGVHHATGLL